jgi:hypothetical protein
VLERPKVQRQVVIMMSATEASVMVLRVDKASTVGTASAKGCDKRHLFVKNHRFEQGVTKRRKGETKEGGGKEGGNREAHAGNRADPATQADAERRGGSKSHTGAQTNRNK